MTQKNIPGTQSLRRAIAILKILSNSPPDGIKLTEVATRNELHVATCHRLLRALSEEGLVLFTDATKTYRLGPELRRLGWCADQHSGLERTLNPVLERVAERTGDTVFLSVRSGMNAVCLARRQGVYPVRALVLDIGSISPLGVGAGSVALCASLSDSLIAKILAHHETEYSRFNLQPSDVVELVNRTRAQGYAVSDGRVILDCTGVGVLVSTGVGDEKASISVAAVNSRMSPDRRKEIVAEIRAACDALLGQPMGIVGKA
jgi:DNA-binding IclR family transcriptional regulator